MRNFFLTFLALSFTSYYFPIIILIINLLKFKKTSRFDRWLYVFISYNALIVCAEQFFLYGNIQSFNPIYNVQTIVDFFFLFTLLVILLEEIKISCLIFKIIAYSFIVLSVVDTFFIRDLYSNNYFETIFSKFLVIVLAFYTFYQLELQENFNKGKKIFVYTLLIYACSTFTISLFEEYFRSKDNDQLYIIWSVLFLLTIMYNLFLTLSLWKLKR